MRGVSMNKVEKRCAKEGAAKFLFASNQMYLELKIIKVVLYILSIIPVVICFLPTNTDTTRLVCSMISFILTLINESTSQFMSNYKEKAILEHQLYEAEITGSTFSKIEYDRESTNEMHELAIRKGLPRMKNLSEYPVSYVPQDITDDYSYLYLCRKSAAKYRYLLSRMFYFYFFLLIGIAVIFIGATFSTDTAQTIYYLICFWPLITPFIKDISGCKKCCKQCVKISADIDNFFADGDNSIERLARFYFYVQNIEFEMLQMRPVIFKFFSRIFNKGVNTLTDGVTTRFKEAVVELKSKKYIQKGVIAQPHGKNLITKVDIDLEELKRKQKLAREKAKRKAEMESVDATFVDAEIIEPDPIYVEQKPRTPRVSQPRQLTTLTNDSTVKKTRAPRTTSTSTATKSATKAPAKTSTTKTTTNASGTPRAKKKTTN